MKKNYYLLLVLIVLFSCDLFQEEEQTAPRVSKVITRINDYSNYEGYDDFSICYSFYVYLENDYDNDNIDSLRITSPDGGYWEYNESRLEDNWDTNNNRFDFRCYSDTNPDSFYLGVHTIEVRKDGADSSDYTFSIYGRGDRSEDTGYIYSQRASGTPKLLAAPTDGTFTINGNDLEIIFRLNESIATHISFWLYSYNGSNYEYLGDITGSVIEENIDISGEINTQSIDVSSFNNITHIRIVSASDNLEDDSYVYYLACGPRLSHN